MTFSGLSLLLSFAGVVVVVVEEEEADGSTLTKFPDGSDGLIRS